MSKFMARVVSVYVGKEDVLGKEPRSFIEAELDGIKADRHKSISRECWKGDKQAEGSKRRNERQWSAVSVEEMAVMEREMDLSGELTAAELGANICFEGIADLSHLPKGTIFKFPSGATLMVEEYNPPCSGMADKMAETHRTNSGEPLKGAAFSKASKYRRGLVGVVEVEGIISAGDEVTVEVYQPPKWIARLSGS